MLCGLQRFPVDSLVYHLDVLLEHTPRNAT